MAILCEAFAVPAFVCPECGQDFESMWQVAVGDSGEYQPVFGGPVVLDVVRCNNCNMNLERVDGGPWHRQGSQ
jgi:hypothetical protein